jgi:hypothetical protein
MTVATAKVDEPVSTTDKALEGLIEQTLVALEEGILPIESLQAQGLYLENEALLKDEDVISALDRQAQARMMLDEKMAGDEAYARQAMQSLKDNLRLTPAVMSLEQLRTRAAVMAHIARAQSKANPSFCRYFPYDFSFLLDVDPTWLEGLPSDIVQKAASDERVAIKRLLGGMMVIDVNDSSKLSTISIFAGEWFAGLDDQTRIEIGQARVNDNYCLLWAKLLDDLGRMSAAFPVTGHKLLRPLMLNAPRGWIDHGRWHSDKDLIE